MTAPPSIELHYSDEHIKFDHRVGNIDKASSNELEHIRQELDYVRTAICCQIITAQVRENVERVIKGAKE